MQENLPNNPFAMPSVGIMLDKPRNLIYDFNALCLIEEKTGRSLILETAGWFPSMRDMRIVIWAGLQYEDTTLTVEAVGRMIPANRIKELSVAVKQALAMVAVDEENKAPLVPGSQETVKP